MSVLAFDRSGGARLVRTAGPGRWSGVHDGVARVVRFRNLRYARAARFEPPTPLPPGQEPNDPTGPVLACPQVRDTHGDMVEVMRDVVMTQDCQVLSVTVPDDLGPHERLPVMVWVHGGSYVAGAGDLSIYDPAALVREGRVIVVAVTYRLGAFGFLGGSGRPANLGLLDLVTALRWVHAGIGELGGDPDRVTLFGQSAGADAIAHLIVADGTHGLFRRAVVQSGPFGLRGRRGGLTAAMEALVGEIAPDASDAEIVALKDPLYRAALRFGWRAGMPFAPQYGEAPLPPERIAERIWARRARDVEILIGWTAEETAFFLGGVPAPLARGMVGTRAGRAARRALVRVTTDSIYRRSGEEFADLLGDAVVGRYEVRWAPPGNQVGAIHVIELPLLFPSADAWRGMRMLGTLDSARLLELGAPLRAAWTAFARGDGAPSGTIVLPDGGEIAVAS